MSTTCKSSTVITMLACQQHATQVLLLRYWHVNNMQVKYCYYNTGMSTTCNSSSVITILACQQHAAQELLLRYWHVNKAEAEVHGASQLHRPQGMQYNTIFVCMSDCTAQGLNVRSLLQTSKQSCSCYLHHLTRAVKEYIPAWQRSGVCRTGRNCCPIPDLVACS